MGTLHLTVVGNPSLYFGASAQALAIRVKRRISWQNRASCVVQSIVLQQGAEIMSLKKTGFLVSDDLRDLPLASVKIPLAQISQIKMESERQGPAGPVHLLVWEDSCNPKLLKWQGQGNPREPKGSQGTTRNAKPCCRTPASAGNNPATQEPDLETYKHYFTQNNAAMTFHLDRHCCMYFWDPRAFLLSACLYHIAVEQSSRPSKKSKSQVPLLTSFIPSFGAQNDISPNILAPTSHESWQPCQMIG